MELFFAGLGINMMPMVKKEYSCWFLINQNTKERAFAGLEKKAAEFFLDFIKKRDYGKSILLFRFDIYIEPIINFGRHNDSVYLHSAHLSANIDKAIFEKSNEDGILKLLLNAALILLKYLAERVVLPKDFDANKLYLDYKDYLSNKSLSLGKDELDKAIVKLFDTIRFDFLVTQTNKVKEDIHYDINEIEYFINNKLAGQTFGNSVGKFNFGYEIADSKGKLPHFPQTANLRRYGTKYKMLLIVKQFDYNHLRNLNKKEQFEILKSKILEAIIDVEKLNRKPKDFDRQKFFTTIENILTEYEKEKL